MRGWPHTLSMVSLWAGVGVMVLAGIALLVTRGTYNRLHLTSLTTSVAMPLVGLAMVLRNGQTFNSGIVVVIVVLLLLTAPVLASATARSELLRTRAERAEEQP